MTDGTDEHGAMPTSRRALLASVGVAAGATAGCLDLFSSEEDSTPVSRTDNPPSTPTKPSTAPPSPTPTPPPTPEEPTDHYTYVSHAQLEGVAERVRSGRDPWKPAYDQAISDAQKALTMQPQSVVDDGAPHWDDPHRFGADEDRHDYQAAIEMTRAVRDTALAYWFTQNDDYAERAIDLLYHWCLDPETKMRPNSDMANNNTEIEMLVTIPNLWYGASLIRGHSYWSEKNSRSLETEFESWVKAFVDSLPNPGYYQYNNMWAWRIATIAGAASFLGDDDRLEQAFCMWRGHCKTQAHGKDRHRPWSQYRKNSPETGFLKRERVREDGLTYHVYGTKALMMTAEIARHHGVDLYSYNAPTDPEEGPTLKKLFDFMAPYLKSPSTWKWGTGQNGLTNVEKNNYASVYELAYSRWEDDTYLEVIQSFGRPAFDFWILGWTTLTHGNWFEIEGSN